MLTRRSILASGATGAALLAAPAVLRAQSWFSAYPFALGVAAGDPAPDGFVIWTKLSPDPMGSGMHQGAPPYPLPVQWEVAEDSGFRTVAAKGEAWARPEIGHAVHVEVSGLKPDRPYWYRFTLGSDRSLRGKARTLPATGAAIETARFAVCGCQNYEDGYFGAYRHLAQESDLAFVYHYGDFFYEYAQDYEWDKNGQPTAPVRRHAFRELYSLDDYRRAYAQYLLDMDLQAARASHAFLASFDDHEVHNNWVSDIDGKLFNSTTPDVPPELFAFRRAAAMQVWYEHMPVRRAQMPRGGLVMLNRQLRIGDLLNVTMLDTRSFRTDQPCDDGFKPASCPGVADRNAQVLGQAQEKWLDGALRTPATWQALAQQIMVMNLDRRRGDEPEKLLNLDSWAGYAVPRERLLGRLRSASNAVVLTGDEHQNYAGLLIDRDRPVAVEIVSTSISSGGDGQDQRPGSDKILARNPELKFINDQRGYTVNRISRDAWETDFMVMDAVTAPGGAISKRTTGTIARGKADIAIA